MDWIDAEVEKVGDVILNQPQGVLSIRLDDL